MILSRVSVSKTNAFLIQVFYPKDLSIDEMNVLIVVINQISRAVTSPFQNKLKSDLFVIFMIKLRVTGEQAHGLQYCIIKIQLIKNNSKFTQYHLKCVLKQEAF